MEQFDTVLKYCLLKSKCNIFIPFLEPQHNLQCTVFKCCILYLEHGILYLEHCILYLEHCFLYLEHCILYLKHCIMYLEHCIL